MIRALILFALLFVEFAAIAQVTFPDGIYTSRDQLMRKKPRYAETLEVRPSRSDSVLAGRVNQFRLHSPDRSHRFLRKDVYAYVQNGEVYLNAWRLDRYDGFAKCLNSGNFMVFWSVSRPEDSGYEFGHWFAMRAGYMAELVTDIINEAAAPDTLGFEPFVLSLRTTNVRTFTKDYLKARLESYPDLLGEYLALDSIAQDSMALPFLNRINELIESGH